MMEEKVLTLQDIEDLHQLSGVSYELSKEALEYSGGDTLEALIWLEQHGHIPSSGTSRYSTQPSPKKEETKNAHPPHQTEPSVQLHPVAQKDASSYDQKEDEDPFQRVLDLLKRWLLDNRLEIYRLDSSSVYQLPIGVVLILLCLSFFWVVPVVMIIGYFIGWRYRLAGPDLGKKQVNDVMESMNDTATSVVDSVKKTINDHQNGRKR